MKVSPLLGYPEADQLRISVLGDVVLDEFMMNNLEPQTLGKSRGNVRTQRRHLSRHCD